jgi:hypothetical protein
MLHGCVILVHTCGLVTDALKATRKMGIYFINVYVFLSWSILSNSTNTKCQMSAIRKTVGKSGDFGTSISLKYEQAITYLN